MRYPASEKLEIIRIVEQSHLPVRRTLDKLGILPGSFYRWYDKYRTGAETLRSATEPFCTTKGPGKGTGLGLSMVHCSCART